MAQTDSASNQAQAAHSKSDVPNTENSVTVTLADLPLHCPLPGTSLWNSHPRVFLAIEETGSAKCSYCGAQFTLDRSN